MIKNELENNETVVPNTHELEQLKKALPQYFDQGGNFLMDKFQSMLGESKVDVSKEAYELNFLGKSYAKYLAGLATETVIIPDVEHNNDARNKDSENIYIVGDNLDALKHLKNSYKGQIKCVYIDPPYNTGKGDFAYNDTFGFTIKDLVEKVGLDEGEAERVLDLQGRASHSAWLTFMLPRLIIARELLASEGVFFISVDDNEQGNLRLICDEIFHENNFVAQIVRKGTGGKQDSTHFAAKHEYVLAYAKDFNQAQLGLDVIENRIYPHVDDDGRAYRTQLLRKWGDNDRREDRSNLYYPIPAPDGTDLFPVRPDGSDGCWRWEKTPTMSDALDSGMVHFEKDGSSWVAYQKIYEDSDSNEKKFGTLIEKADDLSVDKLENLFQEPKPFKYPKPVGFVKQLLKRARLDSGDIILDFFSGSGSTAHAAYRLGAETGHKFKVITVQLPEVLETKAPGRSHGFETIDEIGRERIKRAADKVKEDTGADIDYGFKLFRLEEPTLQALDTIEKFDPSQTGLFDIDRVEDFAPEDGTATGKDVILTTWLNKDRQGLTPNVFTVKLDSYELLVSDKYAYIIDPGFDSSDLVKLVELLEEGDLNIHYLICLPYSLTFSSSREIEAALSSMKNNQTVKLEMRY